MLANLAFVTHCCSITCRTTAQIQALFRFFMLSCVRAAVPGVKLFPLLGFKHFHLRCWQCTADMSAGVCRCRFDCRRRVALHCCIACQASGRQTEVQAMV